MTNKALGILSLGIAGLAIGIAVYLLSRTSLGWGLIYLLGLFIGGYVIISQYCAKCPCKLCCPHMVTGWLARKFNRQPGAYTRSELVGLVVSILFIFLAPLIWLVGYPLILVVYLGLNALTVGIIWVWLCKTCANIHCPIRNARLSREFE